jgi:hypothetical protein
VGRHIVGRHIVPTYKGLLAFPRSTGPFSIDGGSRQVLARKKENSKNMITNLF